jgi:hypothetical protein
MQELLRSNKTEGGVVLLAMFRTLNDDWNLMPIWPLIEEKPLVPKSNYAVPVRIFMIIQ